MNSTFNTYEHDHTDHPLTSTIKSPLIEKRNGTYAAVKYDEASCAIIESLIKQWNIPNPIKTNHLHSTIIYSRKPIPVEKQHNMDDVELKRRGWKFPIGSFKMLDTSSENHDGIVLVLMLDAPELIALHDTLVVNGASHDFATYDVHITLSYSAKGFDWSKIQIPDICLVPSEIYFEPLDLNWKD